MPRIVIDPLNPDIVYAAALGHNYTFNEERGIYKTSDAGKTWKQLSNGIPGAAYIGRIAVAIAPSNTVKIPRFLASAQISLTGKITP